MVNAMVGILASGGSTNETMHLVAIARSAGICIDWNDFAELSDAVPLLVRIYPNGPGDINSFQQAGGMALFFRELLGAGLLHREVDTVAGPGLEAYLQAPACRESRWSGNQGRRKAVIQRSSPLWTRPLPPWAGSGCCLEPGPGHYEDLQAWARGERRTPIPGPRAMVLHSQLN